MLESNSDSIQKAGGPKTPAGKARSSRNALKHGVFAAVPIIQGQESWQAWETHLNGLIESLKPIGYFENLLVFRLACLSWRLSRVTRFEAEVTASNVARTEVDLNNDPRYLCKPEKDLALLVKLEKRRRRLPEPELLDKVARYESSIERSFFRTLHELERLQAVRCGAVVSPPAVVDVDVTVQTEEPTKSDANLIPSSTSLDLGQPRLQNEPT